MATKADISKAMGFIKKTGAQDVYLKFVDLLGRWHQVGLPTSNFGPELFSKGVNFDGSSIPGFTRLESGDLNLIPDPKAFFAEEVGHTSAVSFICDCIEADTRQPFARDPRRVAERAELYRRSPA